MPNSLYVLDFDGVISDTREECLVTSFNAYQKMRNHSPYPVFQAEDISAEYRSKFRECRFLVRVACDFKLLWDMIIAGQHIYPSLSLRQQTLVDLDQLNRYHALFFEQRLCWMEQDLESWLAHNSLYPGVADKLAEWIQAGRLFIASAKDKNSILKILGYYSLTISPELVFGMEGGDKNLQYREISRQNNGTTIHLIDDHWENLIFGKELGFKLYLATWGYTSKEYQSPLSEQGVTLLSLDQFLSL